MITANVVDKKSVVADRLLGMKKDSQCKGHITISIKFVKNLLMNVSCPTIV
jgi:hypothetical protein